jgi:transcriptional regulator with XRE-family HTH domain
LLFEVPDPQPARLVLLERGVTIRSVADYLGMTEDHLGRVLNGYHPVSMKVRQGVAKLLGLPEAELWRPPDPPRPPRRTGRRPRVAIMAGRGGDAT